VAGPDSFSFSLLQANNIKREKTIIEPYLTIFSKLFKLILSD
jgi:hypothetical protein